MARDTTNVPYMGWPFMTNINSTVQNELTRRAATRIRSLSPFIKMIPGVSIDNKKIILKSLEDNSSDNNPPQFQFTDLYRPDHSMRPLSGITGFDVDFKNPKGSIRRATVTWLCHTMDDLERLWVYFMNPGKTALIEWGWNEGASEVDTTDNYNKEGWDIFTYYAKLRKKVLKSSGNYDAMVGFITNYSFSINNDNSITCTTEITSPGVMLEGLDLKNQYTKDPMGNLQEFITKNFASFIVNEYNLQKQSPPQDKSSYIYLADSDDHENDATLDDFSAEYFFLSWGFIEDKILNPRLKIVTIDDQMIYGFDSQDVKIGNHEYLRSTDYTKCIVPNKNKVMSGRHSTAGITPFDKYNDMTNTFTTVNASDDSSNSFSTYKKTGVDDDIEYGYLRNLLINADFFKSMVETNNTVLDLIEAIFDTVNNACGNFWDFQIRVMEDNYSDENLATQNFAEEPVDTSNNLSYLKYTDFNILINELAPTTDKPLVKYTVMDLGFSDKAVDIDSLYTFRVKSFLTKNEEERESVRSTSVIKNVSLTSNLSTQVSLGVMYAAQKDKDDYNTIGHANLNAISSIYKVDNDSLIDTFSGHPYEQDNQWEKGSTTNDNEELTDEEDALKLEKEQYIIDRKNLAKWPASLSGYSPFRYWGYNPPVGKSTATSSPATALDFGVDGESAMKMALKVKAENDVRSQVPVMLHLDMEIEGISGLRVGEILTLDYLPSIYKERGFFQITNISQNITPSYWVTKIKSAFRVSDTTTDKLSTTETRYTSTPSIITKSNSKLDKPITSAEKEAIDTMLVQLWQQDAYFGFTVGDRVIEDAKKIIMAESKYNINAISHYTLVKDRSYGLFQINMIESKEYPPGKKGRDLKAERLGKNVYGSTPNLYDPNFGSVDDLSGGKITLIDHTLDVKAAPYGLWDMKTNMLVAKYLFAKSGFKWSPWGTKKHTKYPNGYPNNEIRGRFKHV